MRRSAACEVGIPGVCIDARMRIQAVNTRVILVAASMIATLGGVGCSDDLGSPCKLKGDVPSDPNVITVQYSPLHPCDSQTCISSQGRNGYCTRECELTAGDDGSGDCPAKYLCAAPDELSEEFKDKLFCMKRPAEGDGGVTPNPPVDTTDGGTDVDGGP
jgi:hypothetical protein